MSNTQTSSGNKAIFGLIARLADNKYFLGRRYAEWCSSAPTLESSVAAAAMAQDELGHARALYPVLKTLAPGGGAELDPETRTQFENLSALDQPFGGWADFVAANFLIDTALTVIFEAAQASSFEPLSGRSRKALQEERTHQMHGDAWVRRMAQASDSSRQALEGALRRTWNETLCWFGPAGADEALAASAVLDATPDGLRERFLAKVAPTLDAMKLNLPVKGARKAGGWKLTEPLPWSAWNPQTYRLTTPAPAITD